MHCRHQDDIFYQDSHFNLSDQILNDVLQSEYLAPITNIPMLKDERAFEGWRSDLEKLAILKKKIIIYFMSKDQNLQSRQIQLAIWTNTCSNMNKYKANVHGYKIQTQKHQTPSPDSDLPRLCAKLPLGRETRLTRWFSSQFAVFHSPTVRYDGKNDSSQVKRQRSFFYRTLAFVVAVLLFTKPSLGRQNETGQMVTLSFTVWEKYSS